MSCNHLRPPARLGVESQDRGPWHHPRGNRV